MFKSFFEGSVIKMRSIAERVFFFNRQCGLLSLDIVLEFFFLNFRHMSIPVVTR